MMLSNHLALCYALLLPSIFPSIRVFSNESVLHIRWSTTGALASASVLSMNIQDWLSLGLTPCSPRDPQESYPTTHFKSINSSASSDYIYVLSIYVYIYVHNITPKKNVLFKGNFPPLLFFFPSGPFHSYIFAKSLSHQLNVWFPLSLDIPENSLNVVSFKTTEVCNRIMYWVNESHQPTHG